ncbi:MAG TPA: STAS domain-containing protein [Herpetosiphonaceae bacterium]|nr:STAS domain-containing protein [Herpetosiphonaceae bacterium]
MTSDNLTALEKENRRLRERVAELESAAPAPPDLLFKQVVANLLISVDIWQCADLEDIASLRLLYTHRGPYAPQIDLRAKIGGRIRDLLPYVPEDWLASYADVLKTGQPFVVSMMNAPDGEGNLQTFTLRAVRLTHEYLCVMVENVNDRAAVDAAHRQLAEKEDIIRRQHESLMELSTPLIPINDQVMVMPLIGAIDSRRAQQVLDTLLQGIAGARTAVAILDITGVPIVDTQVANALIQAAQSVKLLGAQVVLTGIRPEVAQTLVGLGVNLAGIITMSNLQGGIAYATRIN